MSSVQRVWHLPLLLCALAACSAPEPLPRIAPTGRASTDAVPLAAADAPGSGARELEVLWVGDRDGDGPLLVLLHGYGAPADDLVPLARHLRAQTNDSLRIALPGAPLRMGLGRAWWTIEPGGPRPVDRSAEHPGGMEAAKRDLDALLSLWRQEGRAVPARTVIAGFSQGGMLAMEVGLHSEPPPAGIASLSGGALSADRWVARSVSAPPLFASHGRSDPLLSFGAAERMMTAFDEAGADVTWLPFDGTHAIPPVVQSGLVAFVARELALP